MAKPPKKVVDESENAGSEQVGKALGKVPGMMVNAFTDVMDKLGIVADDESRRPKKAAPVIVIYKHKKKHEEDSSSERKKKADGKGKKPTPPLTKKEDSDRNKRKKEKVEDKRENKPRPKAKEKSDDSGKRKARQPARTGFAELSQLASPSPKDKVDAGIAHDEREKYGQTGDASPQSEYPAEVLAKERNRQIQKAPEAGYTIEQQKPVQQQVLANKTAAYQVIKEIKPYVPDTTSNRAKLAKSGDAPVAKKHKLIADAHQAPTRKKSESKLMLNLNKQKVLGTGDVKKAKGDKIIRKTDIKKKMKNAKNVAVKADISAVKDGNSAGTGFTGYGHLVAPDPETAITNKNKEIHVDEEKKSPRRKMWLLAGLCCVALFAFVMIVIMAVQYGAAVAAESTTNSSEAATIDNIFSEDKSSASPPDSDSSNSTSSTLTTK